MAGNLWFFSALGAAVLWGISYALSEHLLQKKGIPPSFLVLVEASIVIPFYILLARTLGTFKEGLSATFADKNTLFLTLAMGACAMMGNYLIVLSVSLKNATLTSFIEISYPLFTILFVWLFFKEVQLNGATLIGAGLIISGVSVIYLKS